MPRKQPKLKPIPTTLFSFKDNQFTAERSDLYGYEFNSYIMLINPETKNEVLFDLIDVRGDIEGEVLWWMFKSASTRHPQLRIQIFND